MTAPLSDPEHRSRGRPRDPAVDRRIKRAALEVLAQGGLGEFSVDAVCLRAGVPRSTFYRRWPGAVEIVIDAFDDAVRAERLPDTGDLLSDLTAFAARFVALFADPVLGACANLLAAEARLRPDLRRRLQADWTARRAVNLELFERAAARGETLPDIDPGLVFDVINGLAMAGRGAGKGPPDYELVLRRLLGRG